MICPLCYLYFADMIYPWCDLCCGYAIWPPCDLCYGYIFRRVTYAVGKGYVPRVTYTVGIYVRHVTYAGGIYHVCHVTYAAGTWYVHRVTYTVAIWYGRGVTYAVGMWYIPMWLMLWVYISAMWPMLGVYIMSAMWLMLSRLGNLITGFMISDESGNRFFPTAATDYWQGRAGIAYQQTDFSEFFLPNLRTFHYLELSIKSDSAIRVSMSSQKFHNMPIWLRIVSISSFHDLFH